MRVQRVDLGFGKKPKKNESEKKPNIFGSATLGATFGAVSGSLVRKYAPVSDEFFSKIAAEDSDRINEVERNVSDYTNFYGASEIEEARILKTALLQEDLKAQLPKEEPEGIKAILNDEQIKPIVDQDSDELKNAYKALHVQLKDDLSNINDKEVLEMKVSNLSQMSSDTLDRAKQAIFVKDNLIKSKSQLKGLSETGTEGIKKVFENIKNIKEGSDSAKSELKYAFGKMLQVAKKSKRGAETWVLIPAVLFGIAGMGLAVNKQANQELAKEKPFNKTA